MSNFARAVKALNDVDEAIDHLADNEAYVTALSAAGLLMPDLPAYAEAEAEEAWWYEGEFQVGASSPFRNGKRHVVLTNSEPGGVYYFDTESARTYALEILAACEYAEKEQDNE